MKNTIALAIITVLASTGVYVWLNYKDWDETSQVLAPLLIFLLLGIAGGVLAFLYILPMLGDKISETMYSASGEIEPDENSQAIAKLAQGDYDGAIEEYKKLCEANPDDYHPVGEIAKIYVEKLEDPEAAIAHIEAAIGEQEWEQEGASFLINRLADLYIEHRADHPAAKELVGQIIETMPDTRYSANATHRVREIEEAALQAKLAAQRAEANPATDTEGEQA